MFASDEDTAEKPADKPSQPSTQAPAQPTPAPGPAKEKPQAAEAPVWPNKAECNEAEAKFHAQLAQVGGPGCAAEIQGR